MSQPTIDFDDYARNYKEHLNRSIRIVGESGEYFADLKARYVARVVKPEKGKVLDYGCGVGLLTRRLLCHLAGSEIHGFDISVESIAQVPADLRATCRFTAVPSELDLDYDAVVIANVMHHVHPTDRDELLRFVGSRLREHGSLILFEHNPLHPLTRYAVRNCVFDKDAILLWPGEAVRRISTAGLRLVRRDFITFFPRWLSVVRPYEDKLGWCPLGAQYAVVGQRC